MNSLPPPFRSIVRRFLAACKYTISPPPPPPPPPSIHVGPSEIHRIPSPTPSQNHRNPVPAVKPRSPLSSFIDKMAALFNINNNLDATFPKPKPKPKPLMCPVKNLSPTLQSLGNPCLDFFNMMPYTPPETVGELLPRAWAHNPLTTLKLILRMRVYCFDFSDKKGIFTVVLWLHQNHPKTLALNVRWFAEVGCMKYLLDILFSKGKTAKRVVERYNSDSNYRFLYDKISDFFAESLKSDIGFLNSCEFTKIGLAAKWCPSCSTVLFESIAKRVFARESYPSYAEIEEADYSYRVCDRLREEIVAPLQKFLDLPDEWSYLEILYIQERIASLVRKTYNNLFERQFLEFLAELNEGYKEFYEKHEPKRLFEFLAKLDEWEAKKKNSAEALLPHEILSFQGNTEVKEMQWKRMVEDLSKKGKLRNCLSVCDVSESMMAYSEIMSINDDSPIIEHVRDFSRSMSATCMEVCLALGLLISELSEEPWRGNFINFSSVNPQLHRIQGETLQEKVKFMKSIEWEMCIDFQKVYDRILDVAVASKLEEKEMVKRVFVFSDMGFHKASLNPWEMDYHAIHRKYKEKGYGSSVPEIVFWNLHDLTSHWMVPPMTGREKGVVLISGLSKNLLNIFLHNGVVNPEEVMEDAIAREEYQRVSVFD